MTTEFENKALKPNPSPTELLDSQYHEVVQTVTGAEDLKQEAITLGTQARSAKQRAAVQAYLFWRVAHQEPGYLEGRYLEKGISYNQLARNSVNFNPIVRLLYGHLGKDAGWIANMAKSLNAIDDEFLRDPAIYRADPADRLYNWVASNGGLSGIRNKIPDLDAAADQDLISVQIKERASHPKAKYQPPTTEIHRKILQKHTEQLVSAAGTVLPISDVAISNDNAAMMDLVVLLARRDSSGTITYIGSTSDRSLVEVAVTACVRFEHTNLSPILAAITECLLPHCVPKSVVTKGNRRKWFSQHRVLIDDAGHMEKRSESVRLVVTVDGSVVVSKVHASASLTTISKPKLVNLASDETLALRGVDRFFLEHRLLLDGQVSLYRSEPADSFGAVDDAVVADFKHTPAKSLTLESNTLPDRVIYLNPYAQLVAAQPTIKDADEIVYDWEITATKTYFHKFCARGLSPWLSNVKNGIGASGNTAFNIVVTPDHIELQSKWLRDKKCWDRTAAVDPWSVTAFGTDSSIQFASEDTVATSIVINPHDLIELFSVLSTASLIGPVTLRGNESLLNLSWETALATHEAWIPSSNLQGHRSSKHFEVFGDE